MFTTKQREISQTDEINICKELIKDNNHWELLKYGIIDVNRAKRARQQLIDFESRNSVQNQGIKPTINCLDSVKTSSIQKEGVEETKQNQRECTKRSTAHGWVFKLLLIRLIFFSKYSVVTGMTEYDCDKMDLGETKYSMLDTEDCPEASPSSFHLLRNNTPDLVYQESDYYHA